MNFRVDLLIKFEFSMHFFNAKFAGIFTAKFVTISAVALNKQLIKKVDYDTVEVKSIKKNNN